jgi:co-chaperonin GroES (HSP10)
MTNAFSPHRINKLRALSDSVIVTDMEFTGRTLSSGIILHNDNGTTAGIRPRWGQVYAVGPDQKDVTPGQWVCVAHGRWTRGLDIEDHSGTKTIRRIDPNDILLVSDTEPGTDDTISDAIQAQPKNRF